MLCARCGSPLDPEVRFCPSCGEKVVHAVQSTDPFVGRVIGGAYRLQELVGVGGMGRVYCGVQTTLGRSVAVKLIHPHLLSDEQTVARFYNEARAASRLNHPDSVGVIDFGRSDEGDLYLVMEYLSGKDLATIAAHEGPLPFLRIVRVMRRVASALGEAHSLSVIHRDLKPENILIQRTRRGDDNVKLVDFGLATITGPQSSSVTTPGLVCGTPDYMSPEQGRGDPLDGRTDLYSLGVLLFELLTDQLPYIDDTPTKVVLRHIHDPVPDPRAITKARSIPDSLAELTMKLLQKSADDRYQSADELDEALRAVELELEQGTLEQVRCRQCGALNPRSSRFCNDCGARIDASLLRRPMALAGSQVLPPRKGLLGRADDLRRFEEARTRSSEGVRWLQVVGEVGSGLSALLKEFARIATTGGDLCVAARPHSSHARVPYHAIRQLLAALLGCDESELDEHVDSFTAGVARAGFAEARSPRGLLGIPGGSRAEAVGVALANACRLRLEQAPRVVVFVDDLDRCDVLTQDALAALAVHAPANVILVTAHAPLARLQGAANSEQLLVLGLDPVESLALLRGEEPSATARRGGRLLVPLYVEQLAALGFTSVDDETAPSRLADAVLARVSRVSLAERRVLQALSVLGESAEIELLRQLVPSLEVPVLDELRKVGFVRIEGSAVSFRNSLYCELVESSIPAEARRELHAAALAARAGESSQVLADHAYRGDEPLRAMLMLEKVGDLACERGDPDAALASYRRGLELARRESIHAGDTSLDLAVASLARKTAIALAGTGDHVGADGMLREAMELVPPGTRERARMLLQLGRTAIHRERSREAVRFLGQAIEAAEANRDPRCLVDTLVELGQLRLASGEIVAAQHALERAQDGLAELDDVEAEASRIALSLAHIALERRDEEAAENHLFVAFGRARAVGSLALLARVTQQRARLEAQRGQAGRAASSLEEAKQLAADAGDTGLLRELAP